MGTYTQTLSVLQNIEMDKSIDVVFIEDALNKVLLEDIIADIDMPPFDKSAMDGYACRKEDIAKPLKVIEVIEAGKVPQYRITENTCTRIMTGAMIPEGANCVFMLEDSEKIDENYVRCKNLSTKLNICYRGEDFKKDQVLIKAPVIIQPSHLAIMASAGYTHIKVSSLPRVGIIATGSEIVDPGNYPPTGKIRNSNTYQLIGQLQKIGIKPRFYGIVPDELTQLSSIFSESIIHHDIIIVTGGASTGDFDLVPTLLKKFDFTILVERTGIQPGNPMTFSYKNKTFCFGLSGNPVSAFVQFELFVKPFIYRYMNYHWEPLKAQGNMLQDYTRTSGKRYGLIPVLLHSNADVDLIPFHGSAHINAFTTANALLEIPENITRINKGEKVYVRLI